ncbi:MAG: hypothetical protein KA713_20570 [Chryseotalea sp. WA131a]|nr:MAG: hypothetical protein KA713_20570 [Chryseotalea sp. WA131a]
MIKVILCGYRDWAFETFNTISKHPRIKIVEKISSKEEFDKKISQLDPKEVDFILFVGWSWIINKEVTDRYICLGIHPSDLPNFRGGSPIQHQILQGVKKSKVSLMTLSSEKLDGGDIWLKTDLLLSGDSMEDIFRNLTESSINCLNKFLDIYPNIRPLPQKISEGSYFVRRKPEESKMKIEDFSTKSLEEIYDFIRSLTDPYPNAYIEDELGNRLIFKKVKYVQKVNRIE